MGLKGPGVQEGASSTSLRAARGYSPIRARIGFAISNPEEHWLSPQRDTGAQDDHITSDLRRDYLERKELTFGAEKGTRQSADRENRTHRDAKSESGSPAPG